MRQFDREAALATVSTQKVAVVDYTLASKAVIRHLLDYWPHYRGTMEPRQEDLTVREPNMECRRLHYNNPQRRNLSTPFAADLESIDCETCRNKAYRMRGALVTNLEQEFYRDASVRMERHQAARQMLELLAVEPVTLELLRDFLNHGAGRADAAREAIVEMIEPARKQERLRKDAEYLARASGIDVETCLRDLTEADSKGLVSPLREAYVTA